MPTIAAIKKLAASTCGDWQAVEIMAEMAATAYTEGHHDAFGCADLPTPPAVQPPERRRPVVVCLCGSGRFKAAFDAAAFQETLAGKIVLTIACTKNDSALDIDWQHVKPMLDELHLRKIDLADEILVLNVNGYIGESTSREIVYAMQLGKRVRWLEPWNVDKDLVDHRFGSWQVPNAASKASAQESEECQEARL
jgi:hypothetical protein